MVSGNNSLHPAAKVWGLFDLTATVRSASPREPQPQQISFFLSCSPHFQNQSVTPHCRACGCHIQAPGPLSPSPWQDPCPRHLSSPLAGRSQPLSSKIWNLISKAGMLKPFVDSSSQHLVWTSVPPRQSPTHLPHLLYFSFTCHFSSTRNPPTFIPCPHYFPLPITKVASGNPFFPLY